MNSNEREDGTWHAAHHKACSSCGFALMLLQVADFVLLSCNDPSSLDSGQTCMCGDTKHIKLCIYLCGHHSLGVYAWVMAP
jgi:hypothetical protein